MNQTETATLTGAPVAATLSDMQNLTIDALAGEKYLAKQNKKGARVVAAFDVLEDLVIARNTGDTPGLLERLDQYVRDFKA